MKRSLGIIFIVAAALAAVVYFHDLRHAPSARAVNNVPKPTFAVTADSINTIKLQHAGATTNLTFDRRNDGWYLTEPMSARGDQPRVTYLANQIAAMQTQRSFSTTPDRFASFGLDHPRTILEFTTSSGKSHSLRLGAEDFSETSLYVQIDDTREISLVSETILDTINWSFDDFRDHTILDVPMSNATSFVLTNRSGGKIEAVKKDSSWVVVEPHTGLGDPWVVMSLLEKVRLGRVSSFVSDAATQSSNDLEKYGLAKPVIELRVTVATAPTLSRSATLQVGSKDGDEYYARDTSRPYIFTISEDLYRGFNQAFKDILQQSDSKPGGVAPRSE